jgi:hypothetical protein
MPELPIRKFRVEMKRTTSGPAFRNSREQRATRKFKPCGNDRWNAVKWDHEIGHVKWKWNNPFCYFIVSLIGQSGLPDTEPCEPRTRETDH